MTDINSESRLSSHTTLKIGGPAASLCFAKSHEELASAIDLARKKDLAWRVIGQGSNILAADEGIDAAIIIFKNDDLPIDAENNVITVSGASILSTLVTFASSRGLQGLENLAGIPGTVGGAIAGNAGAYGSAIGDHLVCAEVMDFSGQISKLSRDEFKFSYRRSILKESGLALVSATFELKEASAETLKRHIEDRLIDRAKKHPNPTTIPTAGSWFKNPITNDGNKIAAGKLLEEAGCKGLKVGGASVWHKHANIIVTDGKASARDVVCLSDEMALRVEQNFGIKLEWEVDYLK